MPRRVMLEGWAEKPTANFRFALKGPQRITHFARLRGVKENLDYFIETAGALGERLGPVLFQLPPDFPRDVDLLRDFLAQIDGRVRGAFEFRNRSWFDDSVLDALRRGGAALCIAESDRIASPVEPTASHAYLRRRTEPYDTAHPAHWPHPLLRL